MLFIIIFDTLSFPVTANQDKRRAALSFLYLSVRFLAPSADAGHTACIAVILHHYKMFAAASEPSRHRVGRYGSQQRHRDVWRDGNVLVIFIHREIR